eukprot:superscaffoldBa00000270_g3371
MRTARKGSVEMPAFVRQLVKETEKRVSSFFKGGRGGAAEGEQPGEGEKEEVIPSPYLDRPVLDKLTEEGCARWGLTYALGSMQGWRANMEDFHNCVPQLGGELADWSFFAVFDGHAGSTVAQYCSQHLLGHMLATGGMGPEDDPEKVCFSTEDHKPYCPLEKERIESAGGSVSIQRINGSLAVSRALGDFSYKGAENRTPSQQMVSPEPEVCVVERSPADEFLVLACDGVWDTISNEELCAFIHNRLRVCTDLRDVCTQVIDLCLYKGSLDNISIILLCFPGAPQLSAEALHQEAELEDLLESKVAEIYDELCARGEEPDLLSVLTILASTVIPGLPPGGGIQSKRNCIISAYYQQRETHKPTVPNGLGGS